ncbi:GtrA family protein [Sinirhodobacter populi]|uniref:GtrA family protein n=1 Tax=Paenirhodobacter populi TaxID=2306993 RepID=A0A443KEQ2_9RHOB|nr:GtrA family protein [Sinirhodobacter populi]RWR31073.1 GtrA family protein [Sinirhodobacter populi]
MRGLPLILTYAAFAALAIIVNLGVQRLVLATSLHWGFGAGGGPFVAAMFFGTLAGLVFKYVLDKRWIFADDSTGIKAHGRKFTLYTFMGIFTTAIFWGTESLFWYLWHTDTMREAGAVLGLCIGYVVKYWLDRTLVFTSSSNTAQAGPDTGRRS